MDRNVFILSVDSLHHRGVADALSELRTQTDGVVFTDAVAPATETKSAMPALAAGVYDDSLSGTGLPAAGSPRPAFEIANEHGFETGLWSENFLFGSEYNYDRGVSAGDSGAVSNKKRLARAVKQSGLEPAFEYFEWAFFNLVQPLVDTVSGYTPFYRSATTLNDSAYDWLVGSTGKTGHFGWIHYMDTHHPYEPPAEYLSDEALRTPRSRAQLGELSRELIKSDDVRAVSRDDLADAQTAYRACCRYVTDEIGRFLTRLRSEGYFDPDRDVFVLTADHGECHRPETGVLGHTPATFYEDLLHVPLMIATPEWETQQVDEQVSLIDLLPTVLRLADIPVPDAAEGEPAATPTDLHRNIALAVTKTATDSGWRAFRCARAESGEKIFGQFDDTVVATSYRAGESYDSETVHETTTSPSEVGGEWTPVTAAVDVRGGAIETLSQADEERRAREEHLRDLGYVE